MRVLSVYSYYVATSARVSKRRMFTTSTYYSKYHLVPNRSTPCRLGLAVPVIESDTRTNREKLVARGCDAAASHRRAAYRSQSGTGTHLAAPAAAERSDRRPVYGALNGAEGAVTAPPSSPGCACNAAALYAQLPASVFEFPHSLSLRLRAGALGACRSSADAWQGASMRPSK